MKLKLEAEWCCSGTGKSSRLPAATSVCVCVCDEEGSARTFPLGGVGGGHSSTNKKKRKKQNFKCKIPPKTHRRQTDRKREPRLWFHSGTEFWFQAGTAADLLPCGPSCRGTAPADGRRWTLTSSPLFRSDHAQNSEILREETRTRSPRLVHDTPVCLFLKQLTGNRSGVKRSLLLLEAVGRH